MTNLLMICTGNICRSPIAEGLAPVLGHSMNLQVHAKSAGTLGLINRAADPKSVQVCQDINLDISQHRSQPITQELIDWATYILVMERRHARHVRQHYENADDKTLELGMFCGRPSIPDPIGQNLREFKKCREQIERGLKSFLSQLR